jgi:hypothetical protein
MHCQRLHDPKLAEQRRREYEQEGKLDTDAIRHLTSSPYEVDFRFRKTVADKILKFISAKVDGDEAELEVSIRIHDIINGAVYTRSTATIGMVGEGKNWYMVTFRESNIATK